MKKALLVTTVSGFVPQFEMENVRLLQGMGYEVHYATNYHNVSYGTDNHRLDGTNIIRHQVDFVRSPYDIKGNQKAYRQLYQVMREEGFALVHCHTPMGGVLTRMAARKLGKLRKHEKDKKYERCEKYERHERGGKPEKPASGENTDVPKVPGIIYTAHGFHFYRGAGLRNWLFYYPVEKWLSRYTDVQITINREDYRRAKKHWHKSCRVVYVPGVGVELSHFVEATPEAYEKSLPAAEPERPVENLKREASTDLFTRGELLRRELGIMPDTILFLSVGELIPRKNHVSVLRALARLSKKEAGGLPDFRYMICGHGKLEQQLQKQAEQLGLAKQVIFPGYCEDIRPYLYACDTFVFPSLQEGMPVALLEAAACGCFCIVSDVRGNRDIAKSVPEQVRIYRNEKELEELLLVGFLSGKHRKGKEDPVRKEDFAKQKDFGKKENSAKPENPEKQGDSVRQKELTRQMEKYGRQNVKEKMKKVYGGIDGRK